MITKCVFNSIDLPLDFNYKLVPSKRHSLTKTWSDVDIQVSDYVSKDEAFEFSISGVSSTIRNLFYNAYKSTTSVVFSNYDSNSYDVLVISYTEEEIGGEFNITGKMQKV